MSPLCVAVEWGVQRMARLIDADKALEMFRMAYKETENLVHRGETHLDNLAEGFTETAHIIKYLVPTVYAVPLPEFIELLNRLNEDGLITRRGLRNLNMLIAKYEGGKTDAPD